MRTGAFWVYPSFLHCFCLRVWPGCSVGWLAHQNCSPSQITLPPVPLFLSCLLVRRSLRSLSSRAVEKSCVSQCTVSSGGPVSQSSMTALDSAGLDQPRDVGIYQATGIASCPLVISGSCSDLVPGGESRKASEAVSGEQRSEGAGFLLYLCVVNLEFCLHKFVWDHVKIKLTVRCLHFPIASFLFFSFLFLMGRAWACSEW